MNERVTSARRRRGRAREAADGDARGRARSDDGVVVRDGAHEQWIIDAGARRGANAAHGRGRPTAGDDDDEGGDGGVRRIDHGEERVGRGVFLVVLVLVVVGVDEQTRGLAAAAHSRRRADAAEKRERGVRKRGGERIGGHERDGIRDS